MTNENLDLRQRKFWGWGFASEVTDAVASDAILHALHDRLDSPIQDFGPGPTISEIELKSPRVPIPASLAAICSDMTRDRAEHTYGKNLRDYVRGFERRFDNPPDFVAFPRTEDELTVILDWACTGDVAPSGGCLGQLSCDDWSRGASGAGW
jgi:alkyldihydroxyacetonephosphate synthase